MTPFYEWLTNGGGYGLWLLLSYAVTIILGAATAIVLPLLFYKNAPSKKFEKAFLTPTGEFFLNESLKAYFSSVRLEGSHLVFQLNEGITSVSLTLAVYVQGKFKKTLFVSTKEPCGAFVVETKYQMIDAIVAAVNKVNGQATKAPTFGNMLVKYIIWTVATAAAFLISTIMFGNYYSIYLYKYISVIGWHPQFNVLFYVGFLGLFVAPVAIAAEFGISKLGGKK